MRFRAALAITAFTMCGFPAVTFAQKNSTPCPRVTAKTPEEASQMEQSSNKKGCWARDKNGHLVFLSDSPQNYKPLLGSASGASSTNLTPPPPQLAGDAVGSWKVTLTTNTKISKDVWHRGTLVITPALGVQFKCAQEPSFDANALSWTGPPQDCSEGSGGPYGIHCKWKITKVSPGYYSVGCASSESFVSGTIVVSGNNINGKVVDKADEYVIWSFSLSGTH